MGGTSDVDLYRICIRAGGSFAVTVDGGGGDGQLFLFDSVGMGVAWNDDKGVNAFEPWFPAGDPLLTGLPGGTYYVGLSNFNVDPVSSAGAIFADSTSLEADPVNGPDGVGAGAPLEGWSFGAPGAPALIDAYTITLAGTGACLPPVVSVPADTVTTTTNPAGAVVDYTATATDPEDGDLTPACTPASGTMFPVGTTTVSCTATDAEAISATATFKVTVNTPPVLAVPESFTVPATSAAGAVVTYVTTATDLQDGALTPTCTPASGAQFPVGTTTVDCTAVDAAAATTKATFTVTVSPPATPTPGVPQTSVVKSKVYFAYRGTKLSVTQKATLRTLAAQIPAGATVSTTATGAVRTPGATKADKKRALARARAVRSYLTKLGVPGTIKVTNTLRTRSTTAKARRVNVVITYTK